MSRLFKMPPQLFRIVLLAVGIVGAYSVARYFLTPPSFGEYGWYRGAALAELATRDRVYAGKQACEECHSDEYQKLIKHEHKSLSCEACHGPGEAHVEAEMGKDVALQLQLQKAVRITKDEARKQLMCQNCHDGDNSPDFEFDSYFPHIEHHEKE